MGKTLYILQSEKHQRYYVGSTDDLNRRLWEHNTGQSKYTKTGIPWKLVYFHHFDDSKSGLRAERKIKSLKSRRIIGELITGKIQIMDLPGM
jgi:putative endonuclease